MNYEIDPEEAQRIVFWLRAKVSGIVIEEQPGVNEPEFLLEIKIETKEDKIVLHPIVTFPMFDAGVGLAEIDYDIVGPTGYPISLTTLTFQNRSNA